MADDVTFYERRVKVLLQEVGGKLLKQEGFSGSGLLLTVELPQSRQAEFLSALREEASAGSKISKLRQGVTGESQREAREKDALSSADRTAERKVAPALESSLRIRPKN